MGDWKLIWGFEGYADGYGLNTEPCWNYTPDLADLGLNGNDVTDDPDVQMERWVALAALRRFDPKNITSGTARSSTSQARLLSEYWLTLIF